MHDKKIVDLYWQRSESAIGETRQKYGRYCFSVAYRILCDSDDSEECVNDTYIEAWNSMPPKRPDKLSPFLGAITRNLSIDRWRKRHAEKRGYGETALLISELEECIPAEKTIPEEIENRRIAEVINAFLGELSETDRNIFIQRYWNSRSIKEICRVYGLGESAVKAKLMRTREKLRVRLGEEEIYL